MSTAERVAHHAQHVGVHERFAAREADLDSIMPNHVENMLCVGSCQIDKAVIGRARMHVTIGAFDVAERAGVEPERLEIMKDDMRPGFAPGGQVGVGKLFAGAVGGECCHDGNLAFPARSPIHKSERLGRLLQNERGVIWCNVN